MSRSSRREGGALGQQSWLPLLRPQTDGGSRGLNQREKSPERGREEQRGRGGAAGAAQRGPRASRPEPPSPCSWEMCCPPVAHAGPSLGAAGGRRAGAGAGAALVPAPPPPPGPWGQSLGDVTTHVLGTVPKCGNPWILWIWLLPTVFCRVSVAAPRSPPSWERVLGLGRRPGCSGDRGRACPAVALRELLSRLPERVRFTAFSTKQCRVPRLPQLALGGGLRRRCMHLSRCRAARAAPCPQLPPRSLSSGWGVSGGRSRSGGQPSVP